MYCCSVVYKSMLTNIYTGLYPVQLWVHTAQLRCVLLSISMLTNIHTGLYPVQLWVLTAQLSSVELDAFSSRCWPCLPRCQWASTPGMGVGYELGDWTTNLVYLPDVIIVTHSLSPGPLSRHQPVRIVGLICDHGRDNCSLAVSLSHSATVLSMGVVGFLLRNSGLWGGGLLVG